MRERSPPVIEEGQRASSRVGSSSIKAGHGVAINQESRHKSLVAVIAPIPISAMPLCFANARVCRPRM